MKLTYTNIRRKLQSRSKQELLIDFISDKNNINKAAEGSMQKRIELIHKAELRKRNA
jgi:hypothetical protein